MDLKRVECLLYWKRVRVSWISNYSTQQGLLRWARGSLKKDSWPLKQQARSILTFKKDSFVRKCAKWKTMWNSKRKPSYEQLKSSRRREKTTKWKRKMWRSSKQLLRLNEYLLIIPVSFAQSLLLFPESTVHFSHKEDPSSVSSSNSF